LGVLRLEIGRVRARKIGQQNDCLTEAGDVKGVGLVNVLEKIPGRDERLPEREGLSTVGMRIWNQTLKDEAI
jgi:hypothetical protein